MIEIWKAVKGYEGLYEVSNLGNVRSLDRLSKWDIFFNIIFVLSWLLLVTLIGIFIYGYIEGRLIL